MEHRLDSMLDKEDYWSRMDGETASGAWRTGWCPNCERVTHQQYWSHRGGWVCIDRGDEGKGCNCAVRAAPDELEGMEITKDMIWGG